MWPNTFVSACPVSQEKLVKNESIQVDMIFVLKITM